MITCEVCSDGTPAIAFVDREWHDGTVDLAVAVCRRHSEDDPDGSWKMIGSPVPYISKGDSQ